MEHDYLNSSYRENLIEHLFVGDLLRHLWCSGPHLLEVLDPQVDDGGYDVVLEYGTEVRHIQLKASFEGSKTNYQNVNAKLFSKRKGCVIWIKFNPKTLELGPFLWFGCAPGVPSPKLEEYPVARHAKGDSKGFKALRPSIRRVPRSAFIELPDIMAVAEKLFEFDAT